MLQARPCFELKRKQMDPNGKKIRDTRRKSDTTARSFARFICVGITNTIISFASFKLSLHLLPHFRARTAFSQGAAYAVGTVWSYFLNRTWTFGSDGRVHSEGIRFLVVQTAMLLLSSVYMWIAVDRFGGPANINWLGIMFVVTILNFLLLRRWVFQPRGN